MNVPCRCTGTYGHSEYDATPVLHFPAWHQPREEGENHPWSFSRLPEIPLQASHQLTCFIATLWTLALEQLHCAIAPRMFTHTQSETIQKARHEPAPKTHAVRRAIHSWPRRGSCVLLLNRETGASWACTT